VIGGFVGCSKDDPADPVATSDYDSFTEVIDSGGEWVNETAVTTETIIAEEIDATLEDGSVWVCQTKTVNLEQNPNEFLLYQSGEGIFPGAILQGGLLDQNPPPQVYIDRGPGRVMINLFTGEGTPESHYRDLEEVRQSEVTSAINGLIAGREEFPKQFSLSVTEVATQQHLAIAMGLKYQNFLDAGFEADFSFNASSEYRHWIIKLVQPFYEIIFEAPGDINEWWGPDVVPDDLAPYVGEGNPPVYISSVRYGRIVYVYFESNASSYEIGVDIEASFDAALGGSVDAELSTSYASAAQSSSIKAVVYGGDMDLAALQGDDLNGVMNALNDGQRIQLAQPISYTLRDLKRRQVVRIKEATTYDITQCESVDGGLQDPLFIWDTENISPQTVQRRLGYYAPLDYYEYMSDLSYKSAKVVRNWNDLSDNGINLTTTSVEKSPLYIDPAEGVSGAVVEFFNFAEYPIGANPTVRIRSEDQKSEMAYPAVDLENTNYTLLVVMGMPERIHLAYHVGGSPLIYPRAAACPIIMYSDMWSSWDQPGRNLVVGWSQGNSLGYATTFRFRHEAIEGEDCAMNLQGDLYRVYAMRFSQQDGMYLFIDGNLENHRPDATVPLDRYLNPRLGALIHDWDNVVTDGLSCVRIRRIEAYKRALTDAQIEGRTISMRREYLR
jgi:hypothetical protein